MLQLSAFFLSQASFLENQDWRYPVASLAGTKLTGLKDILEDLFDECPEAEEEEGPLFKKIHLVDVPCSSSDPSDA